MKNLTLLTMTIVAMFWPAATIATAPTPAEAAYLARLQAIVTKYQQPSGAMAAGLSLVQKYPALIVDQDFLALYAEPVAAIHANANELRNLTPPASLAELHKHALAAFGHAERGADLTLQSLRDLDTQAMGESAIELRYATEDLNTVYRLMRKFQPTGGIFPTPTPAPATGANL